LHLLKRIQYNYITGIARKSIHRGKNTFFDIFKNIFHPPVKGKNLLERAYRLDYEVVVKFAYDPKYEEIAFAINHDVAISQLKRGWDARPEIITGTVEINGRRNLRVFNLLEYSLYSTLTPIDQALKNKLSAMIGNLTPY
jgi:hypothetical protein